MDDKQKAWIAWSGFGVVIMAVLFSEPNVCRSTYVKYGLVMPTCTDGIVRQTAELRVWNLRRGAEGNINFHADAHYTTKDSDSIETTRVPALTSIALTLIGDGIKPIAIAPSWYHGEGGSNGQVKLPAELPDGDYKLHAEFETKLGKGALDVPLALYTPARIHVITDRPLYEPGNVVKFRAVVLRARDLAPLDQRPGKWVVKDPSGEILLEEKAAATSWGVVSGSFPLDKGAATGSWNISWVSNDASDEVAIKVQPFTLPRFRIEATASKPYYAPNDTPSVKGAVLYSSGAPVPNAKVDIEWQLDGEWPAPLEWEATLLPKTAVVGANGRFELALPKIPADLQGRTTMTAKLAAVDPAGDRVEGSVVVLLSKDGIQVSAVTELENGLVQGFNNRVYLRVTTPDGSVVRGAKIKVTRAWEGNDPGIDAQLDEDGVASLQLDPGGPVNIVIPPLPYRPQKRAATVTRGEPEELIDGEGASLADQVEMDRWLPALLPCAKWFDSSDAVRVGIRVDRGGGIVAASAGPDAIDQCTAAVVRGKRLPGGKDRMYTLSFTYLDPPIPSLSPNVESALDIPEGFSEKLEAMARGARDCLPQTEDGGLPSMLTWRVTAKSKFVELGGWIPDPKAEVEGAFGARALACAQARINGRIELAEPAEADSLGLARFSVETPMVDGEVRPEATTMLGYELSVVAEIEGKPSTKLRVTPGTVPDLRLRVMPVLAKPGDTITAELIRGPNFRGTLPDELELEHLKGKSKAKVDADHKAQLTIEKGTEGWVEIRGGGQRALVYVRPEAELAVAMKATKPVYRPGDMAQLEITTLLGGRGGEAAVGLIGVDESLGQLVTLPGADDMGRVRPKVETSTPAFGMLDGQALTLGRIRGANAAAATVIRVSAIPKPPELDAVVTAQAETRFDPNEELTDRFYIALAELHIQARAWETSAPAGEKMRPATMARLWNVALAALVKRGQRVDDAYGRRLVLWRLPADLLALTDPRMVIVLGTRLTEDVENWAQWVAKERP